MIDMNDLMKKAQELSQNMQQQQEELAKKSYEVSVGGEMVKTKFNGKMELLPVITPERVSRTRSLSLAGRFPTSYHGGKIWQFMWLAIHGLSGNPKKQI